MLENEAVPLLTGTVIFSGMENLKLPSTPEPIHTNPESKVTVR